MTEAHSQRAHARLAPSAAHRWLNCPGSVAASVGIPETSSRFADEGTAAHTLVERCFREGVDADAYLGRWVWTETGEILSNKEDERSFEVTEEMAEAAQMFLDYVRPLCEGAEVEVEAKLDLRHIEGMDFGTGDFTAFEPEAGALWIVDFKYGSGVVVEPSEENYTPNPQLGTYACGVMRRFATGGVNRVNLVVIQPRAPHPEGPIRSAMFSPLDLMDFEQDLREGAARALAPDAPRHAGDWCRFCPASGQCDEQAKQARAVAEDVFGELLAPARMPPEALADTLRKAHLLKDWLKALQEYAHAEALAGRVPPGFKLVPKRAIRKWSGNAGATALELSVEFGIPSDMLYEPAEVKSPAEVEKLMPGKNKAERAAALAPFVVKESSGTNLVPDDDPRSPSRPTLLEAIE